jgi:GTP pyrophosphokinase
MIVLGDDDVKLLKDKSSNQKWRRFIPFLKKNTATNEELFERERNAISTAQQPPATESSKQSSVDRRKTLILTEDSISRYVICEHCHPIPGDDVLAYHDVEGYITIHNRKCPIADRLKAVEGNNILAAKWDTHKVLYFPAVLHVEGIDRIGVLHQITGVLSQQMNVNISSLNVSTDNGIFVADVVMMVHDLQDLKEIIRDIKKIKEIEKVVRTG